MNLEKSVKKLDIGIGVVHNTTHRKDHVVEAKRCGDGVQRFAALLAFKSLIKTGCPVQVQWPVT